MTSLEDSAARMELLLVERNPCGGKHAYGGEQCHERVKEGVLFCLHGHDTGIHEFINALEATGVITAQEAEEKRTELRTISHELHLKDIDAECVGQDMELKEEDVTRMSAEVRGVQIAAVGKKVSLIHTLKQWQNERTKRTDLNQTFQQK